jgi:hypothetical protein
LAVDEDEWWVMGWWTDDIVEDDFTCVEMLFLEACLA